MEKFDSQYIRSCVRGDPPFCADVCPFHTDIRDFIAKVNRGSFRAAYKVLQQYQVFPGLVTKICDTRCSHACPRRESDAAVRLRDLEEASVRLSGAPAPVRYNLPAKQQKTAVIGAGPCGLSFAIRLSAKKYSVTVFEKNSIPGGSFHDYADADSVEKEIALQSRAGNYDLVCGREISFLQELEDYDAVFIATGKDGSDFGLLDGGRPEIHAGNRDKFFLGGQLTGCDILESIRDGAQAAVDVEKFLKLGTTRFEPERDPRSRLVAPEAIPSVPAVEPAGEDGYTAEEAKAEAARCLRCDCDFCFSACDFMQHYRKYPSQLATAVEFGLRLDVIEPKTNNRMVNSCSDCGTCAAVCPYGVDSGRQLMLARHQMFEQNQLSDAYHGFLLKDMAHAMSEKSFLCRKAPGKETRYLLFPGCQLTASDHRYTKTLYELLLHSEPESGILMACCGAPAFWAGDAALHERILGRIRKAWEDTGKPVFAVACPSCAKHLHRFLPEIPWVTVWSLLRDVPRPAADFSFALADPCAAKEDPRWREDVSSFLSGLGITFRPLREDIRSVPCCGYGGDIEGARPALKEEIAASRIAESDLPYLCYCASCRDIYANRGKEAWHILDLLLGRKEAPGAPNLTERRRQREQARRDILRHHFKEEADMAELPSGNIALSIGEGPREEMERQRLTEDEIRNVLHYAEQTGLWIEDSDGVCIAHLQQGYVTVWVEYTRNDDIFELKHVYSHRMEIEEQGRENVRPEKRYPHYVRS